MCNTMYGTYPGPIDIDAIDKQRKGNGGPSKDKKYFKYDKLGYFARNYRSGGGNKRPGGQKPIPTYSTNSISKGKNRKVDNIKVDYDFANALASLILNNKDSARYVYIVDYNNRSTNDYITLEEYDQYE